EDEAPGPAVAAWGGAEAPARPGVGDVRAAEPSPEIQRVPAPFVVRLPLGDRIHHEERRVARIVAGGQRYPALHSFSGGDGLEEIAAGRPGLVDGHHERWLPGRFDEVHPRGDLRGCLTRPGNVLGRPDEPAAFAVVPPHSVRLDMELFRSR